MRYLRHLKFITPYKNRRNVSFNDIHNNKISAEYIVLNLYDYQNSCNLDNYYFHMICHFFLFFLQVIGVISVFFIVVSIVSFCIKTHPDMRVPLIKNITVSTSNHTIGWTLDKYETRAHDAFFFIECICNAWFTIEIMFRFVSCPNKFDFLKSR